MNHNKITENMDLRLIKELRDDNDKRSEFFHDRDRILFSRSFRRLAAKTQVVTVSGKDSSDHLRSRLTHSLEVMQIASSIGNAINYELERKINSGTNGKKLDIELIEAISLAHDIGHTPYGHVGERALCDSLKESFDCFSGFLNPDYLILPQKS
ncbi:MAG: HD domain-containing protein [Methanosarcina barkeri]|nr:HD domain-containing protein [Methanosarcina sp. ERenArc_MAG2]